jgi:hypothetical protein
MALNYPKNIKIFTHFFLPLKHICLKESIMTGCLQEITVGNKVVIILMDVQKDTKHTI